MYIELSFQTAALVLVTILLICGAGFIWILEIMKKEKAREVHFKKLEELSRKRMLLNISRIIFWLALAIAVCYSFAKANAGI